jgi:hypothetical protein
MYPQLCVTRSQLPAHYHPFSSNVAWYAVLGHLIKDDLPSVSQKSVELVWVDRNAVRAHFIHREDKRDQIPAGLDDLVHLLTPLPADDGRKSDEEPKYKRNVPLVDK